MDSLADLRAILLLNIQRRKLDTSSPDDLVRRFADRFWTKDWPGSTRPQVFYDPRSLELDGRVSVLHAKAVVVDDEAVFPHVAPVSPGPSDPKKAASLTPSTGITSARSR